MIVKPDGAGNNLGAMRKRWLDGFSVWKKLDGNDERERVKLGTYYKAMPCRHDAPRVRSPTRAFRGVNVVMCLTSSGTLVLILIAKQGPRVVVASSAAAAAPFAGSGSPAAAAAAHPRSGPQVL